jgi:hypothetical protein
VFLAVYVVLFALVLASALLWIILAGRTREDSTPLTPLLGVAASALFVAVLGIRVTDFVHAAATGVYSPVALWVTFAFVGFGLLVIGLVGVWVVATRRRNGWMPWAR